MLSVWNILFVLFVVVVVSVLPETVSVFFQLLVSARALPRSEPIYIIYYYILPIYFVVRSTKIFFRETAFVENSIGIFNSKYLNICVVRWIFFLFIFCGVLFYLCGGTWTWVSSHIHA